jgi:hypothetical protein
MDDQTGGWVGGAFDGSTGVVGPCLGCRCVSGQRVAGQGQVRQRGGCPGGFGDAVERVHAGAVAGLDLLNGAPAGRAAGCFVRAPWGRAGGTLTTSLPARAGRSWRRNHREELPKRRIWPVSHPSREPRGSQIVRLPQLDHCTRVALPEGCSYGGNHRSWQGGPRALTLLRISRGSTGLWLGCVRFRAECLAGSSDPLPGWGKLEVTPEAERQRRLVVSLRRCTVPAATGTAARGDRRAAAH